MKWNKRYVILGAAIVLCIGMTAATIAITRGKDNPADIQQNDGSGETQNQGDKVDNKEIDDNQSDGKQPGSAGTGDGTQSSTQENKPNGTQSATGKPNRYMGVGKDDGVTPPTGANASKPSTPGTSTSKPSDSGTGTQKPGGDSAGNVAILDTLAGRKETAISKGYRSWNFADGAEGFALTGNQGGRLQQKNGVLGWEISDKEQMATPEGLAIPTASVSTIELRLMSTKSKTLTVYWRGKGQSFGEAAKATISILGDSKFHDYQIELGQHREWDGQIDQLKFAVESGGKELCIDYIRLSGIYIVPFPFLSGNYDLDVKSLEELKKTYSNLAPGVILGFSARIEYLADTDDSGDYAPYAGAPSYMNLVDPQYYLRLSKASGLPVMVWLRGDPWGDYYHGAYRELRQDGNNYMWTSALDGSHVYKRDETGYAYLSLAQKNLAGQTTDYWKKTDHLLAQCAQVVGKLAKENPDHILGVTTTSELKYNGHPSTESGIDLDYNPNTILEFSEYCKKKYGTIAKLNQACGTNFTTFTLRSTDYDPTTVETQGGFDAPRVRDSKSAFWNLWKEFRVSQVTAAVERQVRIIEKYLDAKYIYTHQIGIGEDPFVSPEEAGDIAGSNVGVDMFNHEVTLPMIKKLASFVAEDPSRTWGVPEWLVMRTTTYNATYAAVEIMGEYGVKYLCPFNWGGNDDYDLRGTQAEKAIVDYLRNLK